MSKKKQKNEALSADSLDAGKEITPTQPTSTPSTEIETPVQATIDEIETTEIETPEIETPEIEKETIEIKLPKGIADTFKARPHIEAAYVSGGKWFFDVRLAKQAFESFDVIENPFHQK